MPTPRSRPSRWAVPFVLAVAAGCGPADNVRSYAVPKTTEPRPNPPAAPAVEPTGADAKDGAGYRILGAMFPADDPAWFFKLPGKASAVAGQETTFDQFLASVRFPNGPTGKPEWELPPGWQEGKQRNVMGSPVFVIQTGAGEMTVMPSKGGVEQNLSRWANQQLGAKAEPGELVAKFTRPVETKGGAKGLRVDAAGPQNPSGGPMMGGR